MKVRLSLAVLAGALIFSGAGVAGAQGTDAAQSALAEVNVPRLVQFAGGLPPGEARPGAVSVTFAIYAEQDGGAALWSETQNVLADVSGHYTALLGTATAGGFPSGLIGTGQSRWLGVSVAREAELPRVLVASVPYALKAGDADTLGGLPASSYVTAQQLAARTASPSVSGGTTVVATSGIATNGAASAPLAGSATQSTAIEAAPTGSGTANFIPLWTSSSNLGDSILFQSGTKLGLGTTTPASTLDINGGQILRGGFYEYPQNTATASAGQPSHSFQWLASVWDSTTAAAVNEAFGFRALPDQNDVATPTAKLDLFYGTGGPTGATSDLGLSIDHTGAITFVSGQTFPGVASIGGANTFTTTQTFNDGLNAQGVTEGLTGLQTSSTGLGAGVIGVSNSSGGYGVIGRSNDVGVYGYSFGPSSTGVGRTEVGVWGDTGGAGGAGYVAVLGTADNNSAGEFINSAQFPALIARNKGAGEAIQAQSTTGTGVFGGNPSLSATGAAYNLNAGVWGDQSEALSVALLATTDDFVASEIANNADGYATQLLINNSSGSGAAALIAGNSNLSKFCEIFANGTMACNGTVEEIATVDGARQVAQHAIQSPENWSEDFGSATLVNGAATVPLEATFAQTVNAGIGYHVYITPSGDCKGLYVASKTASGFEVREMGGGTSNVAFDYRIVAKRAGRESVRLEDVTARTAQVQKMRVATAKPQAGAAKAAPRPSARAVAARASN